VARWFAELRRRFRFQVACTGLPYVTVQPGYATACALAFPGLGFAEEFTFRGYALQTLSEGIGFWPSTPILSSVFGLIHMLFKSDEGWIDPYPWPFTECSAA
jgi:membrane protease YdiL (CAAX protease family)